VQTVGIVGCGLVGTAIAQRLAAAGCSVIGHDLDATRRGPFEHAGGRWSDDNASVFRDADALFLALPDGDATAAALSAAIDSAMPLPSIVVDVGTDDPERVTLLADRLAKRDGALLDAPLSGSSAQIAAGEAVMMIGGNAQAIARATPLLAAITTRRFVLGPSGSGARAKLATNLVLGLNRAALAEGFAFAEALGMDLAIFLAVVRATPANSAAADAKGEKMLRGDYSAQSRVRQHRKDVALMLDMARRHGQRLPLTTAHAALLDAAVAAGDGERDNAAILETFRRLRHVPAAQSALENDP
jgi:3-hydroxyisobutyrate dehydrogenase-like beta-hydroxyacid dehydrogenase